MEFTIAPVSKADYMEIITVWEKSVRATHHFLQEEDIQYYKPLILNTYLDAVELRCARNAAGIAGFVGVAEHNIEMLFIDPEYRGKGVGKQLLDYSIKMLHADKVDVNEQNEQAVGFYLHCGFEIIGRSALDSSGKPFPILHMQLHRQD
ncbi:GNAT family N-acetyltransferase [Chitinophaga pinensis]|uniref:GCN5-related N-acetyltransferase n=1 Tax=Chitinophaga pinensis (strain ATCC 43595 / DSM 2588 / LMG 13176 / NBRC 15968 / NCIMB 11800 / UQM 2034) TaxID=485918 RepID=A0A979G404_CHIPD|nr:GNAT family N-acetyltransferase [Chitinophaga pinensis]ACU60449.1 GCN5-related N-acetyltransferase [Chitinophaga pinensis DSM 2588]